MSLVEKNWSVGVRTALDLVREEVGCRCLSCEFAPGAFTPVVAWLENKGLTKKQICELVK